MILSEYQQLGGKHPETAGYTNTLSYRGVTAPHSGQPFTEEMILGIGGGLGFAYILWEFEKIGGAYLVLAFRNRPQYPVKYFESLSARLGVQVTFQETAGTVKAFKNLETALENGIPPMAWLEFGDEIPYRHHLTGVVNIFGIDADTNTAYLDDRSARPFRVPLDALKTARARVPSYKNRLMLLEPPAEINLETAILAGLQDQVDHLSAPSDSFSLPAIRKWARLMTGTRNKKAWPNVFAQKTRLFGTLRGIYQGIEFSGTGGGGMRGMYADFLREAAPIIGLPALEEIADQYQDLANRWTNLADASLPTEVPIFQETKQLLAQRSATLLEKGSDGVEEILPVEARIQALKEEIDADFPLGEAEIADLFGHLQELLTQIYKQEKKALGALAALL